MFSLKFILFDQPLWLRLFHVTELCIKLLLVLLVLGYSLDHLIENGWLGDEDARWWGFCIEALHRVDVVIVTERFKPLERLLGIWLVGVSPSNHIKRCYLVFSVELDIAEE